MAMLRVRHALIPMCPQPHLDWNPWLWRDRNTPSLCPSCESLVCLSSIALQNPVCADNRMYTVGLFMSCRSGQLVARRQDSGKALARYLAIDHGYHWVHYRFGYHEHWC